MDGVWVVEEFLLEWVGDAEGGRGVKAEETAPRGWRRGIGGCPGGCGVYGRGSAAERDGGGGGGLLGGSGGSTPDDEGCPLGGSGGGTCV